MTFLKLSKSVLFLITTFLLAIDLALLYIFIEIKPQQISTGNNFAEVADLSGNTKSFQELYDYFKNLANNKGGEYAFEVLKRADMPDNTDLHLLGHVVGDVLYEQRGLEGIKICTQDFRNACSHSIVVGTLLEKGPESLDDIAATCRLAPGGKGAYTMCFHGLGHGVLAYTSYELPDAIKLCQKTGTPQYNNREAIECIGGTIMEIISGGDHDKILWEQKKKKYLTTENPLFPCNASYMPLEAQNMCYTYLTPHLFKLAGSDMGSITNEQVTRAFSYCKKIPLSQSLNRDSCFGGFGKEFVVLAQARDIRSIDKMTQEQFGIVNNWCALSGDANARIQCMKSALSSIYWGGENNRLAAIRFCQSQSNADDRDLCFSDLIVAVGYYIDSQDYRNEFCQEVPAEIKQKCKTQLSL